jgi:hypothetical protein
LKRRLDFLNKFCYNGYTTTYGGKKMATESDTVTISKKRFDELTEAEDILDRLYAAGVDNWDGYEIALEDD